MTSLRIFESDLSAVDRRFHELYDPDAHGVGFVLRSDYDLLVSGLKAALGTERVARRAAERRLRQAEMICQPVTAGDPPPPIGEKTESNNLRDATG